MAEKTETGATSTTGSTHAGKAHENLPDFNGRATDYKEYRKRLLLYDRKMELANRGKETAFNVMSSLKGRAWDACEDLEMSALEGGDAMKQILQRLDAVFKFDAITELPSDFEAFFISLQRKRHETMQEYTANFERQLRKLGGHGVQLPDKVVGWFYLRRAGLSQQQRQMIMTTVQTSALSLDTVRKAVNFVIGQDQTPDGHGGGARERWDGRFKKKDDRASIYQVSYDEQEDYMPEDDEDELFYQDAPEVYSYGMEEESHLADDEDIIALAEDNASEYDDIMANYIEARQKLNQMRVSRGYYPVVAMVPEGASRSSSQGGSFSGGGKGKKGKGDKSKKGSKQAPKPPQARMKGKAALGATKCLRCGTAGHTADKCPMGSGSKRKAETSDINMVEEDVVHLHEDDGVESEPDDTAMFDSGAASVVIGYAQFKRYLKVLLMGGYDVHSVPVWKCEKGLRFGNGGKDVTTYCVLVPTFFNGRRRDILMYVLNSNTPCLLGRPALENFGISIDYKSKKISWDGQRFTDATLGPKGEFIVHLAEDLTEILASKNHEAQQVFLPENFEDHVYDQVPLLEMMGTTFEANFMIRCSPSQVRPMVEDTAYYMAADRKAALRDLEEPKARSTTQYRDQMKQARVTGAEEPGYDPDELDADYSPEFDVLDEATEESSRGGEIAPELPGIVLSALPALARAERERSPRRRTVSDVETEAPQPDTARGSGERPESLRGGQRSHRSERPRKSTRTLEPDQIPVPEAADDELAIEDVYMVKVDDLPVGWRCVSGELELDEVYMANQSTQHNKPPERKGEVKVRLLSPDDQALFVEAKRKELEQFFHNDVWEFATPAESQAATDARRVISARWVLTWKRTNEDKPEETPKYKAKARLVLRGFEDPDLLTMKTAAPTASRLARMMLLTTSVWQSWKIWCGDVKAAFLSGANFDRIIVVRLPKDATPLVGDGQVDAQGNTHMRLKKSAYGLADAPVEWYGEAKKRLLKSKWVIHPLDQCCFLMTFESDKGTELCGILILHVDDMLLSGDDRNERFSAALTDLKQKFNFGKWEQLQRDQSIKYCGGQIYLNEWGIEVSYDEYMRKICPVTVQRGRKPSDSLSPSEVSKMRALIGALQWPSTQGLPMLAASTSLQAGCLKDGTVQDLLDLNKTLRFGKSVGDTTIKFLAKPAAASGGLERLTLVAYSDAAFGVRRDHASQGGFIILTCDKTVLDGAKVPASTVSWRSFKLQRVCRSSLAAECQATTTTLDELIMAKTFLEVLKHPGTDLKILKDQLTGVSAAVTDCRALYDAVYRETIQQAQDKRVAIEGLIIKQTLKDAKIQWRWVSSERQLADGLTKVSARQAFSERFKGHYIQLVADESYTAAKKKTQKERAQTLQETRSGTNSHVAQALIATVMSHQVGGVNAWFPSDDATGYFLLGVTFLERLSLWEIVLYGLAMFGCWTLLQRLCQLLHVLLPRAPVSPSASDDDDDIGHRCPSRSIRCGR